MKMTSQRKSAGKARNEIKWWRKKKGSKKNKMHPMVGNFLVDELVGNSNVRQKKPEAWVSPTQMGMDKIRASTNAGKYFVDFASSVTVHGFNHLTAPHRHPLERILVAASVGAAFVSLILLSLNFWNRYQDEATIFVLENDYRNYEVTRPAVLICPIIRIDETMFPAVFGRHGIEDTKEARDFFIFLANATYSNIHETPTYTGVKPNEWLTIIWELKRDPRAETLDDDEEGTWIVTERGLCQIFYSNVDVYMTYEYWMQKNWTIVPQPPTVERYTYKQREIGRSLKVLYDSVHVSVYHPQELPEFEQTGLYTPQKQINKLHFYPQEISTSEDVLSLTVRQRKCKILSEDGLTMWPIYTRNMCIMECRYEMIRTHCGCYPFFARPMPGIPVCGVSQLQCIGKHRAKLMKISSRVANGCGCYYNCDTSLYEEKGLTKATLKVGSPMDTICNIDLEFPMKKVRRELLFGFNDFMASVGGAAGLFLGASVISFVEFFYWATLRLYWYNVNNRRDKEAKLKLRKKFYDKMAKGGPDSVFTPPPKLKISPYKNHRVDIRN